MHKRLRCQRQDPDTGGDWFMNVLCKVFFPMCFPVWKTRASLGNAYRSVGLAAQVLPNSSQQNLWSALQSSFITSLVNSECLIYSILQLLSTLRTHQELCMINLRLYCIITKTYSLPVVFVHTTFTVSRDSSEITRICTSNGEDSVMLLGQEREVQVRR